MKAAARGPAMTMNPRPCGWSDNIHRISTAVEPMAITRLRPYSRNARIHSKKQIRQIADSIQNFGFTNPAISDDDEITGFSLAEVDLLLDEAREASPGPQGGPEDEIPSSIDSISAVSKPGDLWLLDSASA